MANDKFSQLPTVVNATLSDIVAAVQSGNSVQETLQQIFNLFLSKTILSFAGNPNGNVAGNIYQLCWDTSNAVLYICITSGNAATAVWDQAGTIPDATNSAVLVSSSTGSPVWTSTMTNGQIVIGSTGATPVRAALTAGSGISISNGAGSITISSTGSGMGWNEVTNTSANMVADSGYVTNNVGLVTLTLPTTAAFGTPISVIGKGSGGWLIAQNSGQSIRIGNAVSSTGTGGSIASTNAFDSINLICTTADTVWTAVGGPQGNITVT